MPATTRPITQKIIPNTIMPVSGGQKPVLQKPRPPRMSVKPMLRRSNKTDLAGMEFERTTDFVGAGCGEGGGGFGGGCCERGGGADAGRGEREASYCARSAELNRT